MNQTTESEIVAQFAECQTPGECNVQYKQMLEQDELIQRANERRKMYGRLQREREQTIAKANDDEIHSEVRRWRDGDKVYFGTNFRRDWFHPDHGIIKGDRIGRGQWCHVWHYQPRARRLWLCQPGKPRKFENVIDRCFRLSDVKHYQISRTELEIRA